MTKKCLKNKKDSPEMLIKDLFKKGCKKVLTDGGFIEDYITQYCNNVGICTEIAEEAKGIYNRDTKSY